MEAFIREADTLLEMLAQELATAERSSGASDAELRFILGLVRGMRQAAASGQLPPRAARTIGLGRHVANRWTFRTRLGERLVGLEQWFSALGAPGAV